MKRTIMRPKIRKKNSKEALQHFKQGNEQYILGEYLNALKEYDLALKCKFNDPHGLCQTMINIGIEMKLVENTTFDGKVSLMKPGDNKLGREISILEEAIAKSKIYLTNSVRKGDLSYYVKI